MSSLLGNPTLDLFTSRINHQIYRYIFWKPDPKALAIDAFSIKSNTLSYLFLSIFWFAMEGDSRNLRRQIEPKWPRQHWYPSFLRKAKRNMTITPSAKNLLQPQDPQKIHLLHRKLHLQVLLIG